MNRSIMKRKITKISQLLAIAVLVLFTACDDYLNDIPKGQKIPTTWEDYNAFIRNNYTFHYFDSDQLYVLMGDQLKSPTNVSSPSLTRVHYYWEEDVDRMEVMVSGDRNDYYSAYEGIFAWNLIIENTPNATECTEQQRAMLIAQGRVLRTMHYFHLANRYADQYCEATKNNLSVPLVTSASVEAPSPQVTIEELYQFLLDDLHMAVDDLPVNAETILHPNKAAGYGMLARVYLSMSDYENALKYADEALKLNDKLYDWIGFYEDDKKRFDTPNSYLSAPLTDPERENVENYVFGYGSANYSERGLYPSLSYYPLSPERAALFEPGDTRLITKWKLRTASAGFPYYCGIYAVGLNKGGMRSAEMYYIKAECLARQGDINGAMALVNKVRKTRILPEYYQDWTATSVKDAVQKVMADKFNEFIQTQEAFCDMRRLNRDPEYARTLTRTVEGVTYTLQPNSHLWTLPFPREVIENPGNSPIKQNVSR